MWIFSIHILHIASDQEGRFDICPGSKALGNCDMTTPMPTTHICSGFRKSLHRPAWIQGDPDPMVRGHGSCVSRTTMNSL